MARRLPSTRVTADDETSLPTTWRGSTSIPAAARSVYNNIVRAGRQPVATTGVVNAPAGSIVVNGNQPWTDTPINVKKGEQMCFLSSGEIRVANGNSPDTVASPDGAGGFNAPRNNYPYPGSPVGADREGRQRPRRSPIG